MKLRVGIALVASAAAGFALGLLVRSDLGPVRYLAGWRADRIAIIYAPPTNPRYQVMHDLLKQQQVLEKFREYLAPIRLRETLTLKFDQCGTANAWYEPSDHTVTVCYEYVAEVYRARISCETRGASRRAIAAFLSRRRAALSAKSKTSPSASSWQGAVVPPSGAPAPPECMDLRDPARGHRTKTKAGIPRRRPTEGAKPHRAAIPPVRPA
jgi:Putative metallopeptidase